MSRNYLKEAVKLSQSINWTPEQMKKVLDKIMLENPAAFVRACESKNRLDSSCKQNVIIRIIAYPEACKIKVLKAFREITASTLQDAKQAIEGRLPIVVTPCSYLRVTEACSRLRLAGAIVDTIPA
jgi:ribosomal protein L7/L12